MSELVSFECLVALLTLTALEIVLGIDNIVFIAIVTGRLEARVQPRARRLGLLGAMVTRILLLFCITLIMRLDSDLFEVLGQGISGKDLALLGGGIFLLAKATYEIHHKLEGGADTPARSVARAASFIGAIVQIMLIDVVFSLDSVITAIGMTEGIAGDPVRLTIMIAAIMIAVGVMMLFAEPVSAFIERHPTMKMLALAFLLLIGVMLLAEAFDQHVNRGYIYFAMTFSLGVELLNLRARKAAAA